MKHRPSPAEVEHMGRVKFLPCIVCDLRGEVQGSVTEAHHLIRDPKDGSKRKMGEPKPSGYATIPLCQKKHHFNGYFVNMARPTFERLYGNELDLLRLTYERLGVPYPWSRP